MHKLTPVFERVKADLLRAKVGSCLFVCIKLSEFGENKLVGWDLVEAAKDFIRIKLGGVGYSIENSMYRIGVPKNLKLDLLEESATLQHQYMPARAWDEWRKFRILWINSLIAELNANPGYVPVWPQTKVKHEEVRTPATRSAISQVP